MRVTATTVSAVQTVLSVPPNHKHRWDWLHRTGLFKIFRYLAVNFWSYLVSGRTWEGTDRFSRNACHQLQTYAVCTPEERRLKCLTPIRKPRVKNTNSLLKDRWFSAGWYTWQSICTSYVHLIHYPPAVQWQTCASPAATSGISAFPVQCAKRLPTALAACYSVGKAAQCSSLRCQLPAQRNQWTSRRPLTAEDRVRFQIGPCDIAILGQVLLPVLLFSPVTIIPPMLYAHLHLHVVLTRRTNGRSLGTFPNSENIR